MLKKISSVKGAQKLSKEQQLLISGGSVPIFCNTDADCQIPGAPFCISACGTTSSGQQLCIYDNRSCFGGFGG
ncbi:hypothetical protein GCM10011344_36000 [Dokdonia pacifica]|uniref:Uncharacterized protein n=1 Tax=Dokdonia pacifica TaxID=1627892 RepID=A0A239AUF9_9FLAO|nr:hypothetical protein [Dokdonia pacifica]GGG31870.1 hypothetical protein GCM10011344_36000 [Dokdonia pacifica]SNR99336.1 hypothetical protein SAMN06265376_105147 [Dokdonia pacifica]